MQILKAILTKNDCYKAGKNINPKGIVVHSTGANNPTLRRYIAPDDGIIGKNAYNNHWNVSGLSKCVHAFIGEDKDGKVRIYQTLPWTMRCWGCGKGSKGTYNDSYIQFEICEDGLTDQKYFNEVFTQAIELCAYLCKMYDISVSNVISHSEAYKKGYGSNHGDCDHWLKKHGKTMDWFRDSVKSKMNTSNATTTATPSTPAKKGDAKTTFIKGVQKACGAKVDGIAGPETLSKTVTVAAKTNNKHAVVKPLQTYLNTLGFNCGAVDGIAGAKFTSAVKAYQKANGCVADGVITAGQKTWKKLLGLV